MTPERPRRPKFLSPNNLDEVAGVLHDAVDRCLRFRGRERVHVARADGDLENRYCVSLPHKASTLDEVLDRVDDLLGDSINFSSPMFLGFPDAGVAVAGLVGAVVDALAQQNLLNSSFCARAATFVEAATVRWLRELAGFPVPEQFDGVMGLGGVATTGGTSSNLMGLLMARKRAYPDSFERGVPADPRPVVVPARISHYSLRGAAGILGLGTNALVPVRTRGFRYDLAALEETLVDLARSGREPMAVVLNAGDSRTLSVDDIPAVTTLVRKLAPTCWIHVDACHGFQLLFSERTRDRLRGISEVDSISFDPHKVLNIPYVLSYFLFRDPTAAEAFWSSSPLITGDHNSLGRLTPGIGSKSWNSLKLYLLLLHLGVEGVGEMVEQRLALAEAFRLRLESTPGFTCFTPRNDINSVPFVYRGNGPERAPDELARLNRRIYQLLLEEGVTYLHGFDLFDDWNALGHGREASYFVLRYMGGNPATSEADLDRLLGTLVDRSRVAQEEV